MIWWFVFVFFYLMVAGILCGLAAERDCRPDKLDVLVGVLWPVVIPFLLGQLISDTVKIMLGDG